MNKILKMVIEQFAPTYTQYRFDKASNFVSYEQFCEEKAIDRLISLGKELERIKDFKHKTDEELTEMEQAWRDIHHQAVDDMSVEDRNHIYYKEQGINASNELKRRRDEAYAIKMGWRKSS